MAVRLNSKDAAKLGVARRGGSPRSKYRAKPTEYNGVRYASQAEARHAAELDRLVAAGEIRFWVGQPTFRLGCPENVYRADFLVVPIDCPVYVIDVKGMETSKFKHDKKLWAKYGPCRLAVVKGRDTEWIEGGADPCRS